MKTDGCCHAVVYANPCQKKTQNRNTRRGSHQSIKRLSIVILKIACVDQTEKKAAHHHGPNGNGPISLEIMPNHPKKIEEDHLWVQIPPIKHICIPKKEKKRKNKVTEITKWTFRWLKCSRKINSSKKGPIRRDKSKYLGISLQSWFWSISNVIPNVFSKALIGSITAILIIKTYQKCSQTTEMRSKILFLLGK